MPCRAHVPKTVAQHSTAPCRDGVLTCRATRLTPLTWRMNCPSWIGNWGAKEEQCCLWCDYIYIQKVSCNVNTTSSSSEQIAPAFDHRETTGIELPWVNIVRKERRPPYELGQGSSIGPVDGGPESKNRGHNVVSCTIKVGPKFSQTQRQKCR